MHILDHIYVPSPFDVWEIMTVHNFLSFGTLKISCFLTFLILTSIHVYLLDLLDVFPCVTAPIYLLYVSKFPSLIFLMLCPRNANFLSDPNHKSLFCVQFQIILLYKHLSIIKFPLHPIFTTISEDGYNITFERCYHCLQ